MIQRGHLTRLAQHFLVIVSTDTLTDLLPTAWAILATTRPGPLGHPLQLELPAYSAGAHPDLWIRTTQIRTVATEALESIGPLPAVLIEELDRTLPRIMGLPTPDALD